MSIQRWDYDDLCAGPLKFKGEVFVTYDDHVAALRACEERVLKDTATRHLAVIKMIGLGILQTRADELRACEARVIAAAVQRVEALPHSLACVTRDANYSRPCNCLRGDALDAVKGDQP